MSSVAPLLSFQRRRIFRVFPDFPSFVEKPRLRSCDQSQTFKCRSTVQEEMQDFLCTTTKDRHRVLIISEYVACPTMMILSFWFTLCNKYVSNEHNSANLSILSFWNGTYEKKKNVWVIRSKFVLQSRCEFIGEIDFSGSNISERCPTVISLCFSRGSHHIYNCSSVWESVGQPNST